MLINLIPKFKQKPLARVLAPFGVSSLVPRLSMALGLTSAYIRQHIFSQFPASDLHSPHEEGLLSILSIKLPLSQS
jgi:hypothetical protein